MNNRIANITNNILNFLKESNIDDWTDYKNMGKFDYGIINNLILHESENEDEVNEIKFRLRLELSNNKQLTKYLKQLESDEDYEKCDIVIKKILSNNKFK